MTDADVTREILYALGDGAEIPVSELGRRIDCTLGTLYAALEPLIQAGKVESRYETRVNRDGDMYERRMVRLVGHPDATVLTSGADLDAEARITVEPRVVKPVPVWAVLVGFTAFGGLLGALLVRITEAFGVTGLLAALACGLLLVFAFAATVAAAKPKPPRQ